MDGAARPRAVRSRARGRSKAVAAALAACGALAACNAITQLGDRQFVLGDGGGGAGGGACATPDDCPMPEDACLLRTCKGGVCGTEPIADGDPASTQVPFDCKKRSCSGGRVVETADDSDLPKTSSDCDEEVCHGGTPSNPPRAEGSLCSTKGGVVCDGAGACVECARDADCAGPITDCQHPVCVDHRCAVKATADGVALTQQIPGDCKALLCDGRGGVRSIAFNEPDDDADDCTVDTCVGEMPKHTPKAPGSPCGMGLVCNMAGQCAGCTMDAQCRPPQKCGVGGPGVCGCARATCASLGVTCGVHPDGCGGTVVCDRARDGAETDVDCGGAASGCATRCAVGQRCATANDCASGFCVDGVCCNTSCDGACVGCSAAVKGRGSDGICAALPAGTSSANGCAAPATCDGTGNCR